MDEDKFVHSALSDVSGCWDPDKLARTASLVVPELVFGINSDLLRSDINEQWARWFVESVVDPLSFSGNASSYSNVFSSVWTVVSSSLSHLPKPKRRSVAKAVAEAAKEIVDREEEVKTRKSISKKDKLLLLDLAGSQPRCFYCGYEFREWAIQSYIGGSGVDSKAPLYLDILKPSGLKRRHTQIEVDHVVAFSQGGGEGDNLRLACGWCNLAKSSNSSMYDVAGRPLKSGYSELGLRTIPRPFWTVRILALRRRCEFPDGCTATSATHELTIAPVNRKGALNPTNLRVTCKEHDSIRDIRLQPRKIVEQFWGRDE